MGEEGLQRVEASKAAWGSSAFSTRIFSNWAGEILVRRVAAESPRWGFMRRSRGP